jgi:hypothetical protein
LIARYLQFLEGVALDWLGRLGVILTTASFVCLVLMELARLAGLVTSSYAGLVTYLLFPALFVVGLVLIPIGWHRLRQRTGMTMRELARQAKTPDGKADGARVIRWVTILTVVNIVFLMTVSARMMGFMDKSEFCGTACHSVMNPEWVTYQQSPHAHVACVECHVGEGAEAVLDSKLNGLWQIASVTLDLHERPIPTPVHQLRPARETCEKCHWPDKFYGTRLKTMVNYQPDSASTPLYTTLNLKVDAGYGGSRAGIHWHVAAENEVRYASVKDDREQIGWAEVLQPDGSYHRYTSTKSSESSEGSATVRTMDCVDCHNRATHIYEDADRAIDDRIQRGILDRSLPFLKREALHAIAGNYPSREAGHEAITNQINGFYQRQYPQLARRHGVVIDSVISVLKGIFDRNIHPSMNIGWGTYASHIGHVADGGCFRCHNNSMVDEGGQAISSDCALCHSILANDHADPYRYLQPVDTTAPDYYMHYYQREEFLKPPQSEISNPL